jgi:uncharacterized repeat protein (TIGR02543 family)
MKRIFNHSILFCAILAIFGLTSCSSSENDFTSFTGTAIVSIPISGESFGNDVNTRSVPALETVYSAIDLGGGVILETNVTPEYNPIQSRAANTITSGTVFVAVYDGSTLYRTIPNATISNGVISNIEVPIGKPIELVFYANYDDAAQTCTAPTVSGETIISTDNGSGTIDLMRGEISSVVAENTTTLDGFTFKHMYSRAKVTYTVNFGNIDSSITTWFNKESFSSGASVALSDGTVTASTTNISNDFMFDDAAANNTNTVSTNYKYFIADKVDSMTLIASSSEALNRELDKYLMHGIILKSSFKNGTSYNVGIALNIKAYMINFDLNATDAIAGSITSQAKEWGTDVTLKTTANPTREGYVFVGWTLDKTKTTESDIIASGASVSDANLGRTAYSSDSIRLYAVWAKKYDVTTYGYSNSSAYSGCPTAAEAEKYVGAGIYWDSSNLWADMSGNVYRGGVWLMKKTYIPSSTIGSTSGTAIGGTPETVDNYFFLPSIDGNYVNYWLNDGQSLVVSKSGFNILIVSSFFNELGSFSVWSAQ